MGCKNASYLCSKGSLSSFANAQNTFSYYFASCRYHSSSFFHSDFPLSYFKSKKLPRRTPSVLPKGILLGQDIIVHQNKPAKSSMLFGGIILLSETRRFLAMSSYMRYIRDSLLLSFLYYHLLLFR